MNLQAMAVAGREPAAIMAALRRRFTVSTRRLDSVAYQMECRDDEGRIRLRIIYWWVPRLWRWVYNARRGDRP